MLKNIMTGSTNGSYVNSQQSYWSIVLPRKAVLEHILTAKANHMISCNLELIIVSKANDVQITNGANILKEKLGH